MVKKISHLFQFRFFQAPSHRHGLLDWAFYSVFAPIQHLFEGDFNGTRQDEMFFHEFAHSMVMVMKGFPKRLAIQNFGWPTVVETFGKFNNKTAITECLVVAFQNILIKRCYPDYNFKSSVLTDSKTVGSCMAGNILGRRLEAANKTAEDYTNIIESFIKEYTDNPEFDRILNETFVAINNVASKYEMA